MRIYRPSILIVCLAWIGYTQAQTLTVRREGATLHVAAPQLHLLEGKSLEQLHDGSTVSCVFALSLTPDRSSQPTFRIQERFIFSFDLWEERFSVLKAAIPERSASHLTAAAAEAWCLENMPVPLPALSADKTFVI
jgi:hypothetical protein